MSSSDESRLCGDHRRRSATDIMADNSQSSPLPRLLPWLPDDVSLQCIARVPRLFYPNLSLVSRSWRAQLQSPSLFTARSDLCLSKHFLCFAVRTPFSQYMWYLLDHHPANRRLILSLPPPPLSTVGSACTSLGPFIFVLGGSIDNLPTHHVQIFDSRFNRWSLGPRMSVSRQFAAAGVVDGRIYVLGGCSPSSDSWAEVLDHGMAGHRWSSIPTPANVREKWMHGNVVLDGKILAVADRGGVVFDPETLSWNSVSTVLDLGWRGRAAVVGELIFSYDFLGKIKGYDRMEDKWKELEGVEKNLPKFLSGATLADVGGKLCVMWEGRRDRSKQMELMFAEIDMMMEGKGRLSGSIAWSDSIVLPVPKGSTIAHCLAVQL